VTAQQWVDLCAGLFGFGSCRRLADLLDDPRLSVPDLFLSSDPAV
jgi:hypothetical protein